MKRVAVLASGRGSNFQAVIDAIGVGSIPAECVASSLTTPPPMPLSGPGKPGSPSSSWTIPGTIPRRITSPPCSRRCSPYMPTCSSSPGTCASSGTGSSENFPARSSTSTPHSSRVSPDCTPNARHSSTGSRSQGAQSTSWTKGWTLAQSSSSRASRCSQGRRGEPLGEDTLQGTPLPPLGGPCILRRPDRSRWPQGIHHRGALAPSRMTVHRVEPIQRYLPGFT